MALSGISGYGSSFDYTNSTMVDDWYDRANAAADQLKSSLHIDTSDDSKKTGSSGSGSSTSASSGVSGSSSTAAFLTQYQSILEDLESASSRLQVSQRNNVFSGYERAVASGNQSAIQKASDDIVSATQDFVDRYNGAVSLLKNNTGRSSSIAAQLSAFERAVPSVKTLKAAGLSLDTGGKLKLNGDDLKKELEKNYQITKDVLGGQYGIAERAGTKASSVLDTPVDKIVGTAAGAGGSAGSKGKGTPASMLSSDGMAMSDSFMYFAKFAQSSPYGLSNYYMAASLLNTLG